MLLSRVQGFAVPPVVSTTSVMPRHPLDTVLFANQDNNDIINNKEDNSPKDKNEKKNRKGKDNDEDKQKSKEWDNEKWKLSKPSYSDSWLAKIHDQKQDAYQLLTNSLAAWNEDLQREQEQIKEWKDSFDRNNLSDFCPPFNVGMNCLMVGDGSSLFDKEEPTDIVPNSNDSMNAGQRPRRGDQLPWEDEPGAEVTSLEVVLPEASSAGDPSLIPLSSTSDASSQEWRTRLSPRKREKTVPPSSYSSPGFISVADADRPASIYDAIVDQGLLGSVLALEDKATRDKVVNELLFEAATAIREHGIYVLITPTLSQEVQDLLREGSDKAGLEWAFALDGISDTSQVVSVARRYNNGAMPKVGRLSRYQP